MDKLAKWQMIGSANGLQVRMLREAPKTERGKKVRVYVRVEPIPGQAAEVTHVLGYPRRADVMFSLPAK